MPVSINPHYNPPRLRAPTGRIDLDYRSHDGTVILGQDDWEFHTKWSGAGTGSIHFYRDGHGTSCVGVAPGAHRIQDVTALVYESTDFSSRTRTVTNGRVALIENELGYAAAISVVQVTTAPDGEDGARLIGDYRILRDGSRNFSDYPWDDIAEVASGLDARLEDLDSELAEFRDSAPESDTAVFDGFAGIGHNQPPPGEEFQIEIRKARKSLRVLVANKEDRILKPREIAEQRAVLENFLTHATAFLTKRAKQIEEGFFQSIGAGLAAAFGVKLSQAIEAAQKLIAMLP